MWKIQVALILLFVRILFLLLVEDLIVMQIAVIYGITISTLVVAIAFGLIFWFMVQGGGKKKKPSKRFHVRDVVGILGVILAGIMIISEFGIATATNILHNNPILFYCILVPFIIGSLAQWFKLRLM